MTDEKWGFIPGFETYKVSTIGNGMSLNYYGKGKEHPIKTSQNKKGHLRFHFCKNGKRHRMLVHRAVALVFIPIPDKYKGIPIEKLDVHHINFIPWDNRVENLMWLTKKEHNALHKKIKVYQYGLDGVFIREWDSIKDAEETLGIKSISMCCRQKIDYAGDFQWRYEKYERIHPVKTRIEKIVESRRKSVVLFNLDGSKDSEHDSVVSAAKYIGVCDVGVTRCCKGKQKTVGGYIARYM